MSNYFKQILKRFNDKTDLPKTYEEIRYPLEKYNYLETSV